MRAAVAATGIVLALASAAWIVPAAWETYAVFVTFAFAFSFVWLDSDAPTSVPHMATATAFVYLAGLPILFFELVARLAAYPCIFFAARRDWMALPRPLRPLADADPARARRARLDLAAMLGLATIGLAVRAAVVAGARRAGVESPIAMIVLGEPTAYAVMGALSGLLPLPTGEFVVAAPQRLPVEDARVDVIFSAVLIVPFLVLLIVLGWIVYGLEGAAALSVASLGAHGLVQLLTRRRHLLDDRHAALERATATVARKQTLIEEFSQTITHDVRTPLSSIGMEAVDLLAEPGLSDRTRSGLRRIVRLAETVEDMAFALLRMIRIVSEPEPVGPVDLGALTAAVLDMLHPHIAARRLRVEVEEPLPVVPGQAKKLRHVLTNLLENAIRFVPEETGQIVVGAVREDGAVVLSVRDNGVGIAAEHHEAIFEIFRRVPDGGGGTGSGMGLAIVRRIVEGHGGRVWVESAPEVGATFRVRLPAA